MGVYFDNLIIVGSTQATVDTFEQQLLKRFQLLLALDKILKMKITRTTGGGLFLSQSLYAKDVLKCFAEQIDAKPSKLNESVTPVDHKIRLRKGGAINLKFKGDPVEIEKIREKGPLNTPYREVVLSLLGLADRSRPDISYAVSTAIMY